MNVFTVNVDFPGCWVAGVILGMPRYWLHDDIIGVSRAVYVAASAVSEHQSGTIKAILWLLAS